MKKDHAPNTIAVLRDRTIWARFVIDQRGPLADCIRRLLDDPANPKITIQKYYDERVKNE